MGERKICRKSRGTRRLARAASYGWTLPLPECGHRQHPDRTDKTGPVHGTPVEAPPYYNTFIKRGLWLFGAKNRAVKRRRQQCGE